MKKFVVLLTLLSVLLFCQGVFAQESYTDEYDNGYIYISISQDDPTTTYNVFVMAYDQVLACDDTEEDIPEILTDGEVPITVDGNLFTVTYTTTIDPDQEPVVPGAIYEEAIIPAVDIVKPSTTFNLLVNEPEYTNGNLIWGDDEEGTCPGPEPEPEPIAPTDIIPSSYSVSLTPGTTTLITLSFIPTGADDSVLWVSLDPTIADVTEDGYIVAVGTGITQVFAISLVNEEVFATIQVFVNEGRQNNGGMNFFDIGPARPVGNFCNDCTLPATGFSGRVATKLSEQPASVNYTSLNMRVQIPSLNVDAEIATVPVVDNAWAVEWLGDRAGLLSGTYLPGEGTTILAGHNTLNTTEWGPFAMLATLDVNDAIFVTDANNELQSFRVYANELLGPNDMEKLASIAETFENSLVLVTCENEAVSGGYMNRRVVFAKPN